MNSIAILLVVLSAFIHALRNLFTKQSYDKEVFIWWYIFIGLVLYAPVLACVLSKSENSFVGIWIGVLSGVVHFLYWVFMGKSFSYGDLSLTYPIMRSSPALVLILSIVFLNEDITLVGGLGIILIVISMYVPNVNKFIYKNYNKNNKKNTKAILYAFLTMVMVSSYSIIDKIGVHYFHPLVFNYLLMLSGFLFMTFYVISNKGLKKLKESWGQNKITIVLNGVFVFLSYSLILYAFTIERASYIVGLRQVSVVFAVIMGGVFLKEKEVKWRVVSALGVFGGALCISLG